MMSTTYYSCMLLGLAVILGTTIAQTNRTHKLCESDNQQVAVKHDSGGRIKHEQRRDSEGSCTMRLKGFRDGANVSLPGVDELSPNGCAESSTPKVSINMNRYCAPGRRNSNNTLFIKLQSDEMVVEVERNENDFVIEFYSNGKLIFNSFNA